MMRLIRSKTVVVVAAVASLGALLPAFAERSGNEKIAEEARAKDIVKLIEQGQLDLTGAARVAEKHIQGRALRASCQLLPADDAPNSAPKSKARTDQKNRPMKLVYTITGFSKDQLQVVHVDALKKEVITSEQPNLKP